MNVNDLLDALTPPHECLLLEVVLYVIQDARVGGVRLIQEVLECKACLTNPVTEVLREDLATVSGASSSVCVPHN